MVGQTQTSMCNHSSLPQWSLNRPLLRDHPWTSILMEFRPPTAFTLHLNAPGKEQNQKLGTRFPLPTLLFVFTSAVWMTNETWTETDEHRAALHYTSQGQLKVATLLSSKQNYCQSKGGGGCLSGSLYKANVRFHTCSCQFVMVRSVYCSQLL